VAGRARYGEMDKLMSSSKLKEMRKRVLEELEHIPDWPEPQNELRLIYWRRRMRSLGGKAKERKTAKEVLMESIKRLRESYPNYEPVYDKGYFEKSGSTRVGI
jgi:hypothetical protein